MRRRPAVDRCAVLVQYFAIIASLSCSEAVSPKFLRHQQVHFDELRGSAPRHLLTWDEEGTLWQRRHWADDPKFWVIFAAVILLTALPSLVFIVLAVTDILLERLRHRHNGYTALSLQPMQSADNTNQTLPQREWKSNASNSRQLIRLAADAMMWGHYSWAVIQILIRIHTHRTHGTEMLTLIGFILQTWSIAKFVQMATFAACPDDQSLWNGDNVWRGPEAAADWMRQLKAEPCVMKWEVRKDVYVHPGHKAKCQAAEQLTLHTVRDATGLHYPLEELPAFSRVKVSVQARSANERSAKAWSALKNGILAKHGFSADKYKVDSSITVNQLACHRTIIAPAGPHSLRRFLLRPWVFGLSVLMATDVLYHCWLALACPEMEVQLVKVFDVGPDVPGQGP